eukprot:16436196-Heterocapsa_arctica.AAC.5
MEIGPGPLRGAQGGALQGRLPRRLSKMSRSATSHGRAPLAGLTSMTSTSLSTVLTSVSMPPRYMRAASSSLWEGCARTGP